jgi:signal transduction histidine kinase
VDFKRIIDQLNIFHQSQENKIPIWQYPQFLFLIMGIITIAIISATYAIGIKYIDDPEVVILIILVLSVILLIITFIITQSFEKLVEANRLKSEFVSIVSHQLRSPLSNLRWALELLMSGRLGKIEEPQLDYFRILKDNSSRMSELARDLLIVSRIEQGRMPLNVQHISLNELIKNLIADSLPFAQASNIEIAFESDGNIPDILADPSQVKLVIENLLDNAIRYIKEKGRVEIRLKKKEDFLIFQIKDNGVGIPQADQKYIFQKFFRSSNVLKYRTQGTGLGLFITKAIAEKMGGQIRFKSEENKGTTLWFTLPISTK